MWCHVFSHCHHNFPPSEFDSAASKLCWNRCNSSSDKLTCSKTPPKKTGSSQRNKKKQNKSGGSTVFGIIVLWRHGSVGLLYSDHRFKTCYITQPIFKLEQMKQSIYQPVSKLQNSWGPNFPPKYFPQLMNLQGNFSCVTSAFVGEPSLVVLVGEFAINFWPEMFGFK